MSVFESWQEEKNSVYLYKIIASHEKNNSRKKLFLDLAAIANKQALIWEKELQKNGQTIPKTFQPCLRTKIVGKLIPYFGAQRIRFILSAMKVRGMSVYLNEDPLYPFSATTMHHEHRHKGLNTAGNLRAAIFGINDGLISNMSLILGIAGATTNQHFIILSGIAGLLAGACSMAAGEYISVRSQKEFFEYQIDLERNELEQYPEEEALELAAIYQARGLPKMESEKLATLVINDPERALNTLAREELGLNPQELGSPIGAAFSSFLSFAIGAFIPLIPFTFGVSIWNMPVSIALTAVTLFGIGATLSLFTNSSALKSGLRMLLIGIVAGALTYFIGHWVGVALH